MGDVVVMPGVERRDLRVETEDDQVLRRAMELGITDVVVIGRQHDGTPYVTAVDGDPERTAGRLMLAAMFVSVADNQQEDEEDAPER